MNAISSDRSTETSHLRNQASTPARTERGGYRSGRLMPVDKACQRTSMVTPTVSRRDCASASAGVQAAGVGDPFTNASRGRSLASLLAGVRGDSLAESITWAAIAVSGTTAVAAFLNQAGPTVKHWPLFTQWVERMLG